MPAANLDDPLTPEELAEIEAAERRMQADQAALAAQLRAMSAAEAPKPPAEAPRKPNPATQAAPIPAPKPTVIDPDAGLPEPVRELLNLLRERAKLPEPDAYFTVADRLRDGVLICTLSKNLLHIGNDREDAITNCITDLLHVADAIGLSGDHDMLIAAAREDHATDLRHEAERNRTVPRNAPEWVWKRIIGALADHDKEALSAFLAANGGE